MNKQQLKIMTTWLNLEFRLSVLVIPANSSPALPYQLRSRKRICGSLDINQGPTKELWHYDCTNIYMKYVIDHSTVLPVVQHM